MCRPANGYTPTTYDRTCDTCGAKFVSSHIKRSRCYSCQPRGFGGGKRKKSCGDCGATFIGGPLRTFCGACLSRRYSHRKGFVVEGSIRSRQHACKKCGAMFPDQSRRGGNNKNLYCSRKCASSIRAAAVSAACAEQRFPLDLSEWFHGWDRQRCEARQCIWCGNDFECSSSSPSWWCGCGLKARFNNNAGKECRGCGEGWTEEWGPNAIWCVACARTRAIWLKRIAKRATSNHRKRCKKYGVPFDRSVHKDKVCERDGWVCQICGVKTIKENPDVRRRSPLKGTVDHIIPLSHGIKGHTWDNVQCACRRCNCKVKGDRLLGSQCRLF